MNADSAYIDPFLFDWVDRLQEVMKEREREIINERNLIMPHGALTIHIIKISTYIAHYMQLDHHVKYMALELFDKFMNKYFWEAYEGKNNHSDEWYEEFKVKICTYATLYFLSCFQVASKVNSHANSFKISQILELLDLFDNDYEYTRDMILSMEVEILKKVGYKVPLYTPVDCIEILLAAINFSKVPLNGSREPSECNETLFDISMELLDLAYLEHEKLYHQFQLYLLRRNAQISKQEKELRVRILKSNTLFLSAAIVLCTKYILYPNVNTATERKNLAKLANATDTDLTVMANILFQIMQYSKLE